MKTRLLMMTLAAVVCVFPFMSCAKKSKHSTQRNSKAANASESNGALEMPASDKMKMRKKYSQEQQKNEFLDLVAEVEAGQNITARDIEKRMGKPDLVKHIFSKQYASRIIVTTYRYYLSPGEYDILKSQQVTLGSGGMVDFSFDERVNHDSRGRLHTTDGNTTPLKMILLTDSQGVELRFPTKIRPMYKKS